MERLSDEDKFRMELEKKLRFRMMDDEIISEIKEKLSSEEKYELKIDDERVEAFDEFKSFIEGKENIKILRFDKNKDGADAIAKKSFRVIVEV